MLKLRHEEDTCTNTIATNRDNEGEWGRRKAGKSIKKKTVSVELHSVVGTEIYIYIAVGTLYPRMSRETTEVVD